MGKEVQITERRAQKKGGSESRRGGELAADRLVLSPAEAAEALGIGKTQMYELIAAGDIPCLHVGSRIKISVRRLEEWISEQERREAGE